MDGIREQGSAARHLTSDTVRTRGLCGVQVTPSDLSLHAWGRRSDLNERYCSRCAAMGSAPPYRGFPEAP